MLRLHSVVSPFHYVFLQVNSFVGAFHDAVILYALALNETLEAGFNATNGMEVTRRMWNRTFEGENQRSWVGRRIMTHLSLCGHSVSHLIP